MMRDDDARISLMIDALSRAVRAHFCLQPAKVYAL
jgi:hypothetical protein